MSCCWEGRWMGQAYHLGWHHGDFDSSDERIEGRLVSHRLRSSNTTADGCTNFYERVCGRATYLQDFYPIVLDRESWYIVLNTRFEALLFAKITSDDEPAIRKVKRQYELCMDIDKRKHEGSDLLRSFIEEDSDFPMIMPCNSWDPMTVQVIQSQKYDASLFSINVLHNKIYIHKYDVSVYGRFLSNLKNVSELSHPVMYKIKIKQVFEHLRLLNQKTEYSFERDLDDVMNFRSKLHQIARIRGRNYTRVTVGDLQRLVSIDHAGWSKLDWLTSLRYVFNNLTEVEINSKTEVYVEMEYLIALKELLLQHGPRCIANHIKLHFLETYLLETSGYLGRIAKEMATAAHDTIEQRLRDTHFNPCIDQPHMLRALNYMYLKKWFPKKSRDAALDMVKELKDSLRHYARSTRMISNDKRRWVEDKIERLNVIVGSESKYSDYNLLDPLFKYEVPDDHMSSVLNARRYFKEYEYSTLMKPRNTTLSGFPILEDKPYISAETGIIQLPIGYLHRMSLSATLPGEMSYATLGYKISLYMNEVIIKKGFPLQKFSRESKWYNGNSKTLSNRFACIANQYRLRDLERPSSTDEKLKNKNDDHMLERYVYDNAAFQTLYSAFHTALHEGRIAIKDKSSITHMEQEFIVNWANRYCVHDKQDTRSPSQLRVNNVLRNAHVFHYSFNCSDKTSMNPPNKCIFWG